MNQTMLMLKKSVKAADLGSSQVNDGSTPICTGTDAMYSTGGLSRNISWKICSAGQGAAKPPPAALKHPQERPDDRKGQPQYGEDAKQPGALPNQGGALLGRLNYRTVDGFLQRLDAGQDGPAVGEEILHIAQE